MCIYKYNYMGFLKQGYPQIIHLLMVFPYKQPILGNHIVGNPHICIYGIP